MRSLRCVSVMACAALIAVADCALTQEHTADSLNEANNPLTPKITINFQDYYVPSVVGTGGRDANQFLFRGLVPMDAFGAPQLVRFTMASACRDGRSSRASISSSPCRR